jgi:Asp-tRNA(Asn)/Glu-tRNA(Gln) amidotransferase A subunit family amidase
MSGDMTRTGGAPEGDIHPMDKGLARRTFLARSAAVAAAAAAGQLTWAPQSAAAAVAGPKNGPVDWGVGRETASLPKFGPEVYVRPRDEVFDDPTEGTIAELAWLLHRRRISYVDLVDAYLDRIEALDPTLKAFNTVRTAEVRAEARAIAGPVSGRPLLGIPLAIKDNYFTAGTRTTANSYIFENFVPPYDATTVARLKKAGALVIGKTQMGPLATTSATTPNGVRTTLNAWDPGTDPGGSSSGSGTSTAARMAASSIGTQTGGSITSPSNAQNLTGLKPTMGRASLYGIVPLTFTRDHPGPLARSALDAAIMLSVMAGADPHDFRTQGLPPVDDLTTAATPVITRGRVKARWKTRVGVIPGYVSGSSAVQRQAFLDTLAGIENLEVVNVELPDEWALLTGTFNAVRLPERTQPFLPFLKQDLKLFGVSLTSWLQGLFLSGDEYLNGQRAKVALTQRILDTTLAQCDVVVQTEPVPFDIVGLPELALPIGFRTLASGATVPVGTILGAGPYAEDRLLAVAGAYQAVTDFHLRRPADPAPARSRASARSMAGVPAHVLTAEDVVELTE